MNREEAIKTVRNIYQTDREKEALETLIPELAESEDERIRKHIVTFLLEADKMGDTPEEVAKWLAYLEKQKEKNEKYWTEEEIEPIISDYLTGREHYGGMIARLRCLRPKSKDQKPIFRIGDMLKKKGKNYTFLVDKIQDNFYLTKEGCFFPVDEQDKWELMEQKPQDQSVDVIKMSALLAADRLASAEMTGRLKERKEILENPEKYGLQKPAEKQDYSGLNDLERAILRGFLAAGVENVPVGIIKEAAQECLAQIKPAEWIDTDNIGWDEAFACVARAEKSAKNEEEFQNAVTAENWLKRIKFKYYGHPIKQEWSEEQMKVNLPKWRYATKNLSDDVLRMDKDGTIFIDFNVSRGEYYIPLSELRKLPKED